MNLSESMHDTLRYRQTKAELVDYFKQRYPKVRTNKNGQEIAEWRSKLVDAIQPFTDEKRSSLMRRFQGGRGSREKVTPKAAAEYRELGRMLPPLQPKEFHVYGMIWVHYSECEPRDTFDIHIKGGDVQRFMSNPSWQGLVNLYQEDEYDLTEEDGAFPSCNPDGNQIKIDAVY